MVKSSLQVLASTSAVFGLALGAYAASLYVSHGSAVEQAGSRLAAFALLGHTLQLAIVFAVSAVGLTLYDIDARQRRRTRYEND